MNYEVEMKFRVADVPALEAKLAALNAEEIGTVTQSDEYFRHPLRNFAETDEALRIRSEGDSTCLTYKGPKIDSTTKSRREIEVPLAGSEPVARDMGEALQLLGFTSALVVSKRRRKFRLSWLEHELEAVIDDVDRLGTFIELEIVASEQEVDAARELIVSLAEHCQLGETERRGYADMLQQLQTEQASG